MAYVSSNGELLSAREQSGWSLSSIPEMIWSVVEFVGLFFRTMVNPNVTSRGNNYQSNYRPNGSSSSPFNAGGPRRRMGGFGGGGSGSPQCPPMAGGG